MNANQEANGETRLAYILGVPLAANVVRQWPQMGEIVRTRTLIGSIEGNFAELTLEVGRRLPTSRVSSGKFPSTSAMSRLLRTISPICGHWRTTFSARGTPRM